MAQMGHIKDLPHRASVWLSRPAHACRCLTLWPSSSELEMLFQMLGPNGHFLRSQCEPLSFGNKYGLVLYFALPRLFWNAGPKRYDLPSRQGAWENGKMEMKPGQEGPVSGTQSYGFLQFLVSPSAPLPFPTQFACWINCRGKQRFLS